MLRGPIAILMVMLIGNPVCCCAFAGADDRSGEEAASCCQAGSGSPAPLEDEESPVSCPCAKKAGVVAPDKLAVPAPAVLAWLPPLRANRDRCALPVPSAAPVGLPEASFRTLRAKAPPPRLLYGIFRC